MPDDMAPDDMAPDDMAPDDMAPDGTPGAAPTRPGGPRFGLGMPVATVPALAAVIAAGVSPQSLLARHARGDWGEVCEADRRENERALLSGERLLSSYALPGGETVWVITEADRSATTLLLPDDY